MAYNGYTNYETWCAQLHIDNQESTQRYWRDEARIVWRRSRKDAYCSRKENAVHTLADRLNDEHVEAANSLLVGSPYEVGPLADLLRAAIHEINFHEIAKPMIEAAAEGDDE